jgi:hypothetical protein
LATGKIMNNQGSKELKGDLLMLLSIDKQKDDVSGVISSDTEKVDSSDYIILAKAVIEQCFEGAIELGVTPASFRAALKDLVEKL